MESENDTLEEEVVFRTWKTQHFFKWTMALGIQSPCQWMIGVSNHLLSKVFRFHYHSQKVIGSLGWEVKHFSEKTEAFRIRKEVGSFHFWARFGGINLIQMTYIVWRIFPAEYSALFSWKPLAVGPWAFSLVFWVFSSQNHQFCHVTLCERYPFYKPCMEYIDMIQGFSWLYVQFYVRLPSDHSEPTIILRDITVRVWPLLSRCNSQRRCVAREFVNKNSFVLFARC